MGLCVVKNIIVLSYSYSCSLDILFSVKMLLKSGILLSFFWSILNFGYSGISRSRSRIFGILNFRESNFLRENRESCCRSRIIFFPNFPSRIFGKSRTPSLSRRVDWIGRLVREIFVASHGQIRPQSYYKLSFQEYLI